jgi:hypothetical protein
MHVAEQRRGDGLARLGHRWRSVKREPFVVGGGPLRLARMTPTGNVIPPFASPL